MTGEANPRPEGSLAVWTRDGGSCKGPVGTVLSGLSALFGCRDPVGLTGFSSFVDSLSPSVSVLGYLLPCGVAYVEGLQRNLESVFESLLRATLRAFPCL